MVPTSYLTHSVLLDSVPTGNNPEYKRLKEAIQSTKEITHDSSFRQLTDEIDQLESFIKASIRKNEEDERNGVEDPDSGIFLYHQSKQLNALKDQRRKMGADPKDLEELLEKFEVDPVFWTTGPGLLERGSLAFRAAGTVDLPGGAAFQGLVSALVAIVLEVRT